MTSTALDRPPLGTRVRHRIRVCGVVQGVGFRPFVYRLATQLGLSGHVGTDAGGVVAEVEGTVSSVGAFERRLVSDRPPLASIAAVHVTALAGTGEPGFRIVGGEPAAGARTFVAPDVAVCPDCLRELFDPADRRHRYPFVDCTNCGPRFTIIVRLPYDRADTTMRSFDMCRACEAEYRDPGDRRFRAQPVACPDCGPRVWFEGRDGPVDGTDAALAEAQATLGLGDVLAVKGLGGYHLACDARPLAAVARLRDRKGTVDRPLPVMVRDLAAARRISYVSEDEAALLTSPARPIVLLRRRPGSVVNPTVAPGNPYLGVMLPATPLHHLLFHAVPGSTVPVPDVLVVTSGNRSGEPTCYEDADAHKRLEPLADAWLTHNRPVHVPCDDSVVRVVDGTVLPVRRGRGYAPLPVRLPFEAAPSLAVGGPGRTAFCLASGSRAWVSPHLGDMGSPEAQATFDHVVRQFAATYRVEAERFIADRDLDAGADPDDRARRWGHGRPAGVALVQHHHAHVASVMAESGLGPDERVLGFAFDGGGPGTDGAVWGGEVLVAGYDGFKRAVHLRYVPLPGDDPVAVPPYQAALAHLWAAGVDWATDLAPVEAAGRRQAAALHRRLPRGEGCVPTSSMGLLFDAVSSLLDVRQVASYRAQAAVELETVASVHLDGPRPYRFAVAGSEIDAGPVVRSIVADIRAGHPVGAIAAGFHAAVAALVADTARRLRQETGLDRVALSGGVFRNALLHTGARRGLVERGFRVLTHRLVPPDDGGLALGQIAVAGRATVPPAG